MALTKFLLISAIGEQNRFTRKKSTEASDILHETNKSTLSSSKDVLISGLGKCCTKEKRERKGRNNANGTSHNSIFSQRLVEGAQKGAKKV